MHHAPAQILARLLIKLELGVAYNADADWSVLVSSLPDAPNKVISVHDTAGKGVVRTQRGQLVRHSGLQLRVRSTDYNDAYSKIVDVENCLARVFREPLDVLDTVEDVEVAESYVIQTVIQTSAAFPMQRDEKSRDSFVSNFLINYRQL